MAKRKKRPLRRGTPGAAPGTLIADPNAPKPTIDIVLYDEQTFEDKEGVALADIESFKARPGKKLWINVEGLGDIEVVRKIGEIFHLHPLALEDVLNVHQRAKCEEYESAEFIVLRMASWQTTLETEQVAIFIGENFVITFQEGNPG